MFKEKGDHSDNTHYHNTNIIQRNSWSVFIAWGLFHLFLSMRYQCDILTVINSGSQTCKKSMSIVLSPCLLIMLPYVALKLFLITTFRGHPIKLLLNNFHTSKEFESTRVLSLKKGAVVVVEN